MKKAALLIIMSVLLFNCGHKAAPLVKDRLKPKLIRVTVLNRNQIQCTFSEPIDTIQLRGTAITISTGLETLMVRASYPTLSGAEIMFAVDSMQAIEYQIAGYVFDSSMNKGNFIKKFIGSRLPDTIRPSITNYPRGRAAGAIDLIFSEAIDTTRSGFYILPELEYAVKWQGLRMCSLVPADSALWMKDSTIYYLYTSNQIFDLNQNPLRDFLTIFTIDSVYQPLYLEGKALINDTVISTGTAVLFRDRPIGIAIITQGLFKFEVHDSLPFQVTVITDRYSGSGEIAVGGENVISLIEQKIELDDIIH